MATKRSDTRRANRSPREAARRIQNTVDTSSTAESPRGRHLDSTAIPIDDLGFGDTQEVDSQSFQAQKELTKGSLLSWFSAHWQIISGVLIAAFLFLVFTVRLDSKVEVLSDDVKEMKSSVDRLKTDTARTSTQIEHIQRSVDRIEDRSYKSNKN